MAWLAVLTLVAVVILALTGHAAGSASHEDAVNALGVHLLGVVVWTGGLIALVVMRVPLGSDLGATVVALLDRGGLVLRRGGRSPASSRPGSGWGRSTGSFTAYGAVVALKTLAIVALGVFGWLHRRNIAEVLTTDPVTGGRSRGWPWSSSPSWAPRPGWRPCWPAACRRCPTPRRPPAACWS